MVTDKPQQLREIEKRVNLCKKCVLYKRANRGVSGEGSSEAKVFFLGEGPGYYEDQQGRPFVGQAGKLLDQLIQSIGLERKNVFITNVVRHRPFENRDPLPEEIEACNEYTDEQIKIIDPKIIVTLGRFSMNKFLPGEFISKVHGQARFVDFSGKKYIILPMYHPAAALRNGQVMVQLKNDFEKIREFLEEKVEIINREEERPEEVQLSLIK